MALKAEEFGSWLDFKDSRGMIVQAIRTDRADEIFEALKAWRKTRRGTPVGWVVKCRLDSGTADVRDEYVKEAHLTTTTMHFSEAIRFRTLEDAEVEASNWVSATIHPVYRAKKK
jgi:hypothetical protein